MVADVVVVEIAIAIIVFSAFKFDDANAVNAVNAVNEQGRRE